MIKALVFGKSGQLARSLAQCAPDYPEIDLQFVSRRGCDLELSDTVATVIEEACPDIVINTAAYTAVDQAESEPEKAQVVNSDAVKVMAEVTKKRSIPLIHFSTDYVFDGTGTVPYRETDVTMPRGVYGKTKLSGEEAVRKNTAKHLIFRTSWVYSPYGKNFVKTMLCLMAQNEQIRVVDDQIGCPTSAQDIAHAVMRVAKVALVPGFDSFGVYHLVGREVMTWHGFACKIQNAASTVLGESWGGSNCMVNAVTSDAFPMAAKRPSYSVLSTERFEDMFGFVLPAFNESLKATLSDLREGEYNA